MQLIIDTSGTRLSVKNKCFHLKKDKMERQISPKRVSSIAITSNCLMNTAAIRLAARNQVPIMVFDSIGNIEATVRSPYFVNIAALRKKQLIFTESTEATKWIINILTLKTENQYITLNRLTDRKPKHRKLLLAYKSKMNAALKSMQQFSNTRISNSRNEILGFEGNLSRLYFQTLNEFLPANFRYEKRSRRPGLDYFNAALNYFYGVTYSVVESSIFAKGLDPFIGILHADSFKNPTLVYDLIEPVRPIIDRHLVRLIQGGVLRPNHFIEKHPGYWMKKEGKRAVIRSFNELLHTRMAFNNKIRRFKDHVYELSNHLGNLIDRQISL